MRNGTKMISVHVRPFLAVGTLKVAAGGNFSAGIQSCAAMRTIVAPTLVGGHAHSVVVLILLLSFSDDAVGERALAVSEADKHHYAHPSQYKQKDNADKDRHQAKQQVMTTHARGFRSFRWRSQDSDMSASVDGVGLLIANLSRIPLTNDGEFSAPNSLASSMHSFSTTAAGVWMNSIS